MLLEALIVEVRDESLLRIIIRVSTLILDFICLFIFVYIYTEMEFFIFRKLNFCCNQDIEEAWFTGYEQKATVFCFSQSFQNIFNYSVGAVYLIRRKT